VRTLIQLSLSVVLVALTSAPARASLIIYDMFGAVGELNLDVPNPLISLGISTGDPIHLVVHVDTDAPDLCEQPGKGLYPLPFAAMDLDGTIYSQFPEPFGGFVEVNNAAGNCAAPGDDHTGVAIRLLIGPTGMTLFGPDHVGESLPLPLFSLDGVGGDFGLVSSSFADVTFDDIRAQEVVPEPATLLLVAGGLAAARIRRRQRD
jgi:hypothetical protein